MNRYGFCFIRIRRVLPRATVALLTGICCLQTPLAQAVAEGATEAGNCATEKQALRLRGATVRLENDLFAGTDQNYTNGVALTLVSYDIRAKVRTESLPAPVRLPAQLIQAMNPGFWADADSPAATQYVVVKLWRRWHREATSQSMKEVVMFRSHRYIEKHRVLTPGVSLALIASAAIGAPPSDSLTREVQAQIAKLSPEDRALVQRFTPELQEKFLALSPELRATLKKVHGSHTRHSNELTLRQVMQEILSEYQGIAAGVATDNADQIADSTRRLANHRIPLGGLIPYFPLDKIDNESLSVLPAMNDAVEGAALRLAEAADRGNMAKAATGLGDIASGRVACHPFFRGRPGESPLLASTDQT